MGKIITLLSDFGTRDHYVAAMKGVLLSRCPEAVLVDISHAVPPQDIAAAAYLLAGCRREFPEGTVHLAVVDPGVGGRRKPLALAADGGYFVGPDNGIFTHVLREAEGWDAREITAGGLFRRPVSATFHGRDVFAPAAAELANGFAFEDLGPPVDAPQLLDMLEVEAGAGEIRACVIHRDRFGNLITSVRAEHLERADLSRETITLEIAGATIRVFADHYAAAPGGPFMLFGSGGYLELAVSNGSAAETLGADRGEEVVIRFTT